MPADSLTSSKRASKGAAPAGAGGGAGGEAASAASPAAAASAARPARPSRQATLTALDTGGSVLALRERQGLRVALLARIQGGGALEGLDRLRALVQPQIDLPQHV